MLMSQIKCHWTYLVCLQNLYFNSESRYRNSWSIKHDSWCTSHWPPNTNLYSRPIVPQTWLLAAHSVTLKHDSWRPSKITLCDPHINPHTPLLATHSLVSKHWLSALLNVPQHKLLAALPPIHPKHKSLQPSHWPSNTTLGSPPNNLHIWLYLYE